MIENNEHSPSRKIHLICACDHGYGIGRDGTIPWKLSSDMRNFSRKTAGKPMIMGRRTFESLPFVLHGRDHIVITSSPERYSDLKKSERVYLVDTYARAVELAHAKSTDAYVIGGQRVYAEALPSADTLTLSVVHGVYKSDTWFPATLQDLSTLGYDVHSTVFHPQSANDERPFTVVEFTRHRPHPT